MRLGSLSLGGLFLFGALIAACSGGGGSSAIPRGGSNAQSTASATIHVLIPKNGGSTSASSPRTKPNYISSSTATIDIGVYTVNGATPNPLPTPVSVAIATSSDCTTVSGGTSCTIVVTVPVATAVVLQLTALDASGNLLGSSLIGPINTTLSTIPTQNLSLGGVPASLVFSRAGLSAGDSGATQMIPFTVSALDADGNTIVQPAGDYPSPIALTITGDTNGALSLSATSFASPGPTDGENAATLTYTSSIPITTATITATSGSVTASVPFAPIVFTPTSLNLAVGGSSTVTVSEAGYSGAFSAPSGSPLLSFTCSPSNCTPASAGASVTFTASVLENTPTSSTFPITDSYGGTAEVAFTLSSTTAGGQAVGPQYTIDKYPVPEPSGAAPELYGVAVGSDGQSLWAVDDGNFTLDVIASPSACSASCGVANLSVSPTSPFGSATNPQTIAAGSDGNLYVGDVGGTRFGQGDSGALFALTGCSASSVTCSSVNAQSFGGITVPAPGPLLNGSDGNLYVGSQNDNGFPSLYNFGAPITLSPVIGCCSLSFDGPAIFPADDATSGSSTINGLTIDSSGATLWFTDSGTGNIGYYTLPCTNQCVAYELPSGVGPGQVGDTAHRRLIAARAGKKIVHPYKQHRARDLTPITASPAPLSTALNGIVSGPDGYLYVADAGNHQIDQIDPSVWDGANNEGTPCSSESGYPGTEPASTTCTYVPIALPQTNGIPMNLTVGPDGNVWFTDTTGYVGFVSIAACASSAGCKAFEYSVGGSPWGIAAGADGNIWFTLSSEDASGNSIGKVVLP